MNTALLNKLIKIIETIPDEDFEQARKLLAGMDMIKAERHNQFHSWGCNCAIMKMTTEQAKNTIEDFYYPKDYMEVLTVDERDSFWNGFVNKPSHITKIVRITVSG